MQVYCLEEENLEDLSSKLTRIFAYLSRCFPKGGIPMGLIAWSKCKVIDIQQEFKKPLDVYTQDALQFLQMNK